MWSLSELGSSWGHWAMCSQTDDLQPQTSGLLRLRQENSAKFAGAQFLANEMIPARPVTLSKCAETAANPLHLLEDQDRRARRQQGLSHQLLW